MKTYSIEGMTCPNCVHHVTEAIESVPGVTAVRVDLDSATAEVQGDALEKAIAEAIADAGYSVGV